jgi:thiamine-phosphate pyrophosphorylase
MTPAPFFCLVTDRLGLAASLGSGEEPCGLLVEQVGLAADAGVDLVQVRERDLGAAALAVLVARLVARTRGTRARVVVNDRLDVAIAAGAHGVHLRGDSAPTARVRAAAPPGFLVGRSVRTAEDARLEARGGVDYVVLGTIFPTPSKPGEPTIVGTGELRRAAALSPVPVLGIGGITEERLGEVAAAGAAGVAAIRLFWPGRTDAAPLARALERWRRAFDLSRPIP